MGLGRASLVFLFYVALVTCSLQRLRDDNDEEGAGTRTALSTVHIGFGSCNKHDKDQSYWPRLIDLLAQTTTDGLIDGFVWLGDVVYADRSLFPGVWVTESMDRMKAKYDTFKNSPNYTAFRARVRHGSASIHGVWDDHDMGQNDGGKDFALRGPMQNVFLDFLDVPEASPRRERNGVYSLQGFQFPLPNPTRFPYALCVLLLDARSHRDPLGSNGDMLGDEQWAWLEAVLRDPTAELPASSGSGTLATQCAVTAIGSGVQVLADEKPTESWGEFLSSRRRLLDLLGETGMERFVFISGDVHYADLIVEPRSAFGFPLVEMTSSGLTHSVGALLPDSIFDWACATPRRRGRYLHKNVGAVTVSADSSGSTQLTLAAYALDGVPLTNAPVLHYSVDLQALSRQQKTTASTTEPQETVSYDIEVYSGPLKMMLFSLRALLFPRIAIHQLLVGFLGFLAAVAAMVLLFMLVLVWRCCRKQPRRRAGVKQD